MKPSNIALLSLAFAFLVGMFFTNSILKKEYVKIDLDDPLKDYVSVDYESFSVLKISGSNGYPIEIEAAEKEDIKVLRRRMGFFKKELKGDTLHITFSGSNIPLEQAANSTTQPGIKIQGSAFSQIIIKDTYTRIKGLTEKNLNLYLEGNASTAVLDCRFGSLSIAAKNNSRFEFKQHNSVDTLAFTLANTSMGYLKNIDFSVLQPTLGDSAVVAMSGSSLMEIIK